MGCDIHFFVEVRFGDTWHEVGRGNRKETREVVDRAKVYEGAHRKDAVDTLTRMTAFGEKGLVLRESGRGFKRDYDDMFAAARGLPKALSKRLCSFYKEWGSYAHTPSWFTLDELQKARADKSFEAKVLQRGGGTRTSHPLDGLDEAMQDMAELHEDPTQVRCVFWFDN